MIDEIYLKRILTEYENSEKEIENETDFRKIGSIRKLLNKQLPLINKVKEYFLNIENINYAKKLIEEDQNIKIELNNEISFIKKMNNDILEDIKNIIIDNQESHLDKNVFLEIRAGTGGDEASLFAGELYKMYCKYADEMGLNIEEVDISYNELGGIKSIIVLVKGDWAFRYFQFESGGHRVQRVPVTEKNGRVHTSTVTVAILPEEEDNTSDFNMDDVKIEYSTAQGAGGQHVNKTESAVIMTHIPTGIKVKIQDERSQHKNKEKAFRILKFRVKESKSSERERELSNNRKEQIGTGERNEKIRTYNFPQNRITDHRFNITFYNLQTIIEGEFKEFFEAMVIGNRNKI